MKNIRIFLSENFQFWVLKFSVYLNRRVFVKRSSHNIVCHVVVFIALDKGWGIQINVFLISP